MKSVFLRLDFNQKERCTPEPIFDILYNAYLITFTSRNYEKKKPLCQKKFQV